MIAARCSRCSTKRVIEDKGKEEEEGVREGEEVIGSYVESCESGR
jgi:hypothetical protein